MIITHDEEIERSVLSGLFARPDQLFKIDIVSEDFYFSVNQKIFKFLETNKGDVDTMLLKKELEKNKVEKPLSLISKLQSNILGLRLFLDHVKELKTLSIKRQLEHAQRLNSDLLEATDDVDELISGVQSNIMAVTTLEKEESNGKAIISELEKEQEIFTDKYQSGDKYIGIQCGIEKIDNAIDGLRKGHIWVVGAWASTGKSSFLLNIISNIMGKVPTMLISLEMSKTDIASKIIGIRHKMTQQKVIKGIFDKEIREKIDEGKEFIYTSKLNIYTEYFKLEEIKMLIRKEVYTKGVRVVAIDYAQNILGDGLREYDLLSKVAIDLQALARELKITIIILSQISNESAKGLGAGAGFKGTGAFEAVADLAIRLSRDKKAEIEQGRVERLKQVPMAIEIFKNRHGFTGVIDDYFLHLKSGKLNQVDIYKDIK